MTEQEAIEILRNNFPKTCKMVDGRYKGGFDDTECEFGKALLLSISALFEIQQYRDVGTVEELLELKESTLNGLELANIWAAIQKLKEYETIGTVEECREARKAKEESL